MGRAGAAELAAGRCCQVSAGEPLALPQGTWPTADTLFPSSRGRTCTSSVLCGQSTCTKWGLGPALQVHLVEHPQTHTWKISVRSMQSLPGRNFTSSGLLEQGWKEATGVATES